MFLITACLVLFDGSAYLFYLSCRELIEIVSHVLLPFLG